MSRPSHISVSTEDDFDDDPTGDSVDANGRRDEDPTGDSVDTDVRRDDEPTGDFEDDRGNVKLENVEDLADGLRAWLPPGHRP